MKASVAVNTVNGLRKSGTWPLSMTVMIMLALRPWFPGLFHMAQHHPTVTPDLTTLPNREHNIEHVSKPSPPLGLVLNVRRHRRFYSSSRALPRDLHVEQACRHEKSRTTPQLSTAKPGYNDIGLRNTSSITSDFCGTN
jgi:hypothetical protein